MIAITLLEKEYAKFFDQIFNSLSEWKKNTDLLDN